jgi:hypothetical protein
MLPDTILVTFSFFCIVKSIGFERRHLTAVTSKKSVKTKTVMKMPFFAILKSLYLYRLSLAVKQVKARPTNRY